MKIAIAQITTDPGKIEQNVQKIIHYIDRARAQGARLVVFPELAVPGYGIMDLAYNMRYVADNKTAVMSLAEHTKNIAVVAGFVDFEEKKTRAGGRPLLYNSAAVFDNGKFLGIQDKTLLPDYDIFYEERYFVSGRGRKVFEIDGQKIGVEICEDMWDQEYPVKVSQELIEKGASLLVNISASPFHIGKVPERDRNIRRFAKHNVPFVYANLVGSFDGYDGEIVFDGRSMAYNREGELVAICKGFEEELHLLDTEDRTSIPLPSYDPDEELFDALVLGIKEYYRRNGFKRAYIGLSGGIDSAVVAALAVYALGKENVIGVTMPSHVTSSETKSDAILLAERFGMRCDERSIKEEYNAWLEGFKKSANREPESLTKQNKQARIRGTILMEYTNEDRYGIVISTGNKTELALGYCTLYGDMCGGFAAISDVSKERIYSLARYINRLAKKEVIPVTIIDRVPTAELEPGQTDRANLPADYPVLSPLVDVMVEEHFSIDELAQRYPREVVERTAKLIHNNEFKRRQAPPGIRVTKRAFGIGRRVPMGHGYIR